MTTARLAFLEQRLTAVLEASTRRLECHLDVLVRGVRRQMLVIGALIAIDAVMLVKLCVS